MSENTTPSLRLAKVLTPGFYDESGTELYGDEPSFYRPWQETIEGAAERFRATIALTLSGQLMYPTKDNLRARDVSMKAHPLDNLDEITAMRSDFQFLLDGAKPGATAEAPAQESHHGIELVTRDGHPRVRHHEPHHSNFCPWPRPVEKASKLRRHAV